MQYAPKIQYGTVPTTLQLSLPQKLWTPFSRAHGGSNVSDSGVPEAFIIRRDQLVNLDLRFTEAEWPSVAAWLEFVQSTAAAFDFWFDPNDVATKYTVYLESPKLGDGTIEPSRDEFREHFSIRVTLRSTSSTRFDVRTQ